MIARFWRRFRGQVALARGNVSRRSAEKPASPEKRRAVAAAEAAEVAAEAAATAADNKGSEANQQAAARAAADTGRAAPGLLGLGRNRGNNYKSTAGPGPENKTQPRSWAAPGSCRSHRSDGSPRIRDSQQALSHRDHKLKAHHNKIRINNIILFKIH